MSKTQKLLSIGKDIERAFDEFLPGEWMVDRVVRFDT